MYKYGSYILNNCWLVVCRLDDEIRVSGRYSVDKYICSDNMYCCSKKEGQFFEYMYTCIHVIPMYNLVSHFINGYLISI